MSGVLEKARHENHNIFTNNMVHSEKTCHANALKEKIYLMSKASLKTQAKLGYSFVLYPPLGADTTESTLTAIARFEGKNLVHR
jgi:hypothetical protein